MLTVPHESGSQALEPEVIELVHYFKISDRHARMLNEQLKPLGFRQLSLLHLAIYIF